MTQPVYRIGPCHVFMGNPNIPNGAGMTFLGFTRDAVEYSPNVNVSYGKVDQVGTAGLAESVHVGGYAPIVGIPLVDEDKEKLGAYVSAARYLGRGGTETVTAPAGAVAVSLSTIVQKAVREGIYLLTVTTGGDAAASRWSLTSPSGELLQTGIRAGAAQDGIETAHFDAKITFAGNVTANDVYMVSFADLEISLGGGSGFTKEDIGTLCCIPSAQLEQGTNGIDAVEGLWLPAVIARDYGSWMFETPDSSDDAMNRRSTQFAGLRVRLDERPQALGGARIVTEADKVLLPTSHRIWWIGSPASIAAQTASGITYQAPSWSLPEAPRG